MTIKDIKKVYRSEINCQKIKIVGWPRCYKKEAPTGKNLWQAIRAMLF